MKKVLSLVLVLCMMLAFVPVVQADEHFEISLNGEWDFKYYADATKVPENVTSIVFEDKIQVPGAMELQGYGYPSYYFEEQGGWGMPEDDGVRSAGIYKLDFFANVDYPCLLCFDNVEDNLTVYINGEKVGESKNGSIGSVIEVPVKDEVNTLICVVERDNSGINKKDDFALSGIMGNVTLTNGITFSNAKVDVEVKENHLVVDGKEVVLKGVKYTPTHPETGNAITDEQIEKDLELIKEYGFNAVWTSCAPDYLYEKAEELGLYIVDEANVNLDNADRDTETAKARVEEMIEQHKGNKSIIMWSVGSGEGNNQQLINAVKELDARPVAQEVTFAPEFEVFGNTGGVADWVATLGNGNVGGFVDEFADKELYYTQNAYVFDTKDTVTGETVTIDGEVENYKGTDMLGDASFTRSIENLDEYTIVTELSAVGGDRVIFENGNIKLEIRNNRVRFNANGQSVRADVSEGKIAAIYADGEIQLFANNTFAGNAAVEADVAGNYTVGGGETAIGYIEIYNDALTLDELIEGADESKLISRIDFEDITVKEDKSYRFLAYGGDFGDNPNSYYKCLTGIFSSTREPHPEAEAFKALLLGEVAGDSPIYSEYATYELIAPVPGENSAVFANGDIAYTVNYEGKITSIKDGDVELLGEAMYPTVIRENTLSEYEMGIEQDEEWKTNKAEIVDNTLYVELISTETEGRLLLAYSLNEAGFKVSVQSRFSDNATKPTFIGFRGVGDYESATWYGSKTSNYPDRMTYDVDVYTLPVSEMEDNYAVPQENGNRAVYAAMLENDIGDMLGFASTTGDMLQFQVHDCSPKAIEDADHDEDIVHEDKAYFRVGGYIAGVGDDRSYDLTDNVYGFDFFIVTNGVSASETPDNTAREIYVNGERYKEFASGVKNYVYQTNEKVEVTADGTAEVVQDDKKAVIGDYTIYFAPAVEYMSDMTAKEATAQIAKDSDFSGNAITMSGSDYWAPATAYDKGVAIKGGSVTYDVSDLTNHTFNAVVGKNSIDWRSMGGGFDRNMFNASCTVTIALDGVVVEEVKDISMRGGNREVNIDVSNAEVMTITVTGSGIAPAYEDAVVANAAFVPNGPVVVNFEKKDGKVYLTVLNTDEDQIDVVLSATENNVVTTTSTRIGKGLYRTIAVDAGEAATAQATITHLGIVTLE